MPTKLNTLNISTQTIVKVVAVGLATALFFKIWEILAALFLAIVLSAALEPTLLWMERHKIKRFISVPGIYLLVLATIFAVSYAILPTLFDEISILAQDFPQKVSDVTEAIFGSALLTNIEFLAPAIDEVFITLRERLAEAVPNIFKFITAIFGGLLSFFLVMIFSFYLSLRKNEVERSLLALMPHKHRDYAGDLFRRIQRRMGRWVQGMFFLSTFIGVSTYIILLVLGVEFALTLAIIAGVLEIVPFLGPIITTVLLVLIASTQSITLALIVAVLFIILQQIESALVAPSVMSRAIGISPILIILAVFAGAQLAGIWGVIISIPLAAALAELFKDMLKT
jgi:predicted PurR-regulated permease PerM